MVGERGQIQVKPGGAMTRTSAEMFTMPADVSLCVGYTAWVASKVTSVGFSHPSSTWLNGSTIAFTSTRDLKPSAPVEARYRQLSGGASPVCRFCSIHHLFGTGVWPGMMHLARKPYSTLASAAVVSCTVSTFLFRGSMTALIVPKVLAFVSVFLEENIRLDSLHSTPSGARTVMKSSKGMRVCDWKRTTTGLGPIWRVTGTTSNLDISTGKR
mmetsp:Transcript_113316/g.360224  ORF Transcript_113316/g.360224 Transcript_113316/m.360224 type:complete len:213 (+) Transcript_113316:3529-4167(+)